MSEKYFGLYQKNTVAKEIGRILGTVGFCAELFNPFSATVWQLRKVHGGNPDWSEKNCYIELLENGVSEDEIKKMGKMTHINYKKVRCIGRVRRTSIAGHELKLNMTEADIPTDGVYTKANGNPFSSPNYFIGLEELASGIGHTWDEVKDLLVKKIDF